MPVPCGHFFSGVGRRESIVRWMGVYRESLFVSGVRKGMYWLVDRGVKVYWGVG